MKTIRKAMIALGVVAVFAIACWSLRDPKTQDGEQFDGQVSVGDTTLVEQADLTPVGEKPRPPVGPGFSPHGQVLFHSCVADPTGTRVAVTCRSRHQTLYNGEGRVNEILLVDLTHETVRSLTVDGVLSGWSPNGKRIAYVRGVKGGPRIFTLDVDDPGRSQMISWVPDGSLYFVWSPNGEFVAIWSFCGPFEPGVLGRNMCLSVARSEGSDLRVIAKWRIIRPGALVWAPRGEYLYFGGVPGKRTGVYRGNRLVRAKIRTSVGRAPGAWTIETIVDNWAGGGICLSADGSRLFYLEYVSENQGARLCMLDTATLERIRLPGPPGASQISDVACSPAGDTIAVTDVEDRLWRIAVEDTTGELVAKEAYQPLWLPKPGQGFIFFRLESPEDVESDILLYHSNDAGTEQRLVARF